MCAVKISFLSRNRNCCLKFLRSLKLFSAVLLLLMTLAVSNCFHSIFTGLRNLPRRRISNQYSHHILRIKFSQLSIQSSMSGFESSASVSSEDFKQHSDALALYQRMRSCSETSIAYQVNKALDTLSDSLRLFGPERLISSFNGGKDAVVIMHLLRAAVAKYTEDKGDPSVIYRPKLMYFTVKDEFPEVLEYIVACEETYNLKLTKFDCGIVKGIEQYINSLGRDAGTVAFVLGTREGDPNSADQQTFSPARNYGQVWQFLLHFQLPYCKLYDRGYTSLGKTTDTYPNPALRRKSLDATSTSNNPDSYWPAHQLVDWSLERAGRMPSNSATGSGGSKAAGPNTVAGNSQQQTMLMKAKTAGMIIIGDEILNGSVQEVNMQLAATRLRAIGLQLNQVSVVPDEIHEIANEIKLFSQKFDVVITSGGIGPTHDDVTAKAVASAFDSPLAINAEMLMHLRNIDGVNDENPSHNRLATMPGNAVLRFPPQSKQTSDKPMWPILQCENVFVLPGVPQYFETKIDIIVDCFLEPNEIHVEKKLCLDIDETDILTALDSTVVRFTDVKVGSYPQLDNPSYRTVITISARNESIANEAVTFLTNLLPADVLRAD